MQKTIVLNYKGQDVISDPYTFKHAVIMDDCRFKGEGLSTGATNALKKMFEGTTITDEIIDNWEDTQELLNVIHKIIDWFLGIDEEVKNS